MNRILYMRLFGVMLALILIGAPAMAVVWDGTEPADVLTGTESCLELKVSKMDMGIMGDTELSCGLQLLEQSLPDKVTINGYASPGTDAYFNLKIEGDTNLDGIRQAWCVDEFNYIYNQKYTNVLVYSSYEALPAAVTTPEPSDVTPPCGQGNDAHIDYPENLDLVNWVINNRAGYTYTEVQNVIWKLVEKCPAVPLTGNEQTLYNAALTHDGFQPDCGQMVAIILVPEDDAQVVIAQVTAAQIKVPCCPKIGDYVWEDTNGNGIQDSGEPGVSGVTVKLFTCEDDTLVKTTTTDAEGQYLFEVPAGNYYVRFFAPDSYIFTIQNAVSDDALDSDADIATGKTECTELIGDETDLTWDAGLQKADPQIGIVKKTNGDDCAGYDDPRVYVGDTITWTYTVTNEGNVPLSDITVTDDKLGAITCPKTTLAVGESMTCTATGIAVMGPYENTATASGTFAKGMFTETDTATDESCYFGTAGETIAGLGYTKSPYNTGNTNFAYIKKGTWFMYLTVNNDIADGTFKEFDLQLGTPKTGLVDVGDVRITRSGTKYTVTYLMEPTINVKGYVYSINVIDEHLGIDLIGGMSFTGSAGRDDNGDFGVSFTDPDGKFYVFPHFGVELGPTPPT